MDKTSLDKWRDCFYNIIVSRRLRAFTWAMKRVARLLGVSVESMVGLVWYHKTARRELKKKHSKEKESLDICRGFLLCVEEK